MQTNKTKDTVFECKDIQIQPDEIVKHLGIHIDNMLKFTEHVTGVINNVDFSVKLSSLFTARRF